jgi:hypothetical protein
MSVKRYLALFLAAVQLSALMTVYALKDPWETTEKLTEDVEFSTGYFDDGDRQAEHYVTYRPGGSVYPLIWYGTTLGNKMPFTKAAEQVEAEGKRVIAGTNGDYYVLSTGQPVGLVICEGRLLTSDGGNPALGFLHDGSAFFGVPALRMALEINGEEYRLAEINKPMHSGDFFLYTDDYGEETPSRGKTKNVILAPQDGAELTVGSEIAMRVESVYWSPGAIPIPKGRWVLCLTADSDDWRLNAAGSLSVGDSITMTISADDPRWGMCTYAGGSLYKLISEGVVAEDLDKLDHSRAPRTAVGIREDGKVILYTIDGRQRPYSAGMTLQETAQRLLELGCVEAGALDGGGSTVLRAQSAGEEETVIRNIPSGGRERDVSTFLLLVTEGESSGQGKTLSVRTGDAAILCGGSLQFTAGVCDEKGAPVAAQRYSWSASAGSIDENGLYTAPEHGGIVEITAKYEDLTGSTRIVVVETPDTLQILSQDSKKEVTKLELDRGESVELTVQASWGLLDILAEDEQFQWQCTGNAGTIDSTGRYTASVNGGKGTVTASFGEMSLTLGVSVMTPYTCIADYEQVNGGAADGLTWHQETVMEHVRYGRGSLRADYDLSNGEAIMPITWNRKEKAQYLYVWVYGDGSDNALYAVQGDRRMLLTTLAYSGWKLITLDVGCTGLDSLLLSGSGTGTFWLDQVLVSNDPLPDLEPPVIDLETDGQQISAVIYDLTDGHPERELLTLRMDGKALPFTYDDTTGVLLADAADDGLMHRVTLIASDRSGNYTAASRLLAGEAASPFTDMEGHWAESYAGYLYRRGVTSGRMEGDTPVFAPNEPMTRAEFAVFLCRWLELDTAYDGRPEFVDAEDIPDWAVEYVYTAAVNGLIQGELNGGELWFKPNDILTRAQAATILGRTLSGGSPYADLFFPDAELIPSWAEPYISRLTYLGVFNGFEDGTFRPSDTLTRAQAAKLLTEMS